MSVVRREDVIGYLLPENEIRCANCYDEDKPEKMKMTELNLITRDEDMKVALFYFCDRCKKEI